MKSYPSHKDSRIEWVGNVPDEWNTIKGKHLFGHRVQKNNVDEPLLSVTQAKGVVRRDELDYRVWNPQDDTSTLKLVLKGDFVISLRTFEGGIELSNIRGIVSTAYTPMFPKGDLIHEYYKYLFKTFGFITELNTITSGIRQGKNISYDDFSGLFILSPPLPEQQQISNFLDQKTKQIDDLVEKTKKKIELLKEKRTSLINHCVTKGLDPNVEMKDSGVEWIGEIPREWDVKRLKYFSSLTTDKEDTKETDIKISPENVESFTGKCFNLYSEYSGQGVPFKSGDILINKLRLYLVKILLPDYDGYSMGEMIVVRVDRLISNKYYFYLFFNQGLIDLLDSQSTGIKVPRVSPEVIMGSYLPQPPLPEQQQISNYLDQKTKQIDTLIEKENKRIELLKEYRQSLISKVVTGKIDVRDEVLQ
jgi:type I restriction enzyme, S subunit